MEPGVKISKQLVGINAVSTALTKLMSVGVLIWMQYYLLRRVSPEEFSIYPLASILLLFLPLVATVFSSSSYRYITLAYANNDLKRITEVTSTLTPIILAAGTSLLVLGLVAVYYLDNILTIAPEYLSDARAMMTLFLISGIFSFILTPFTAAFFALQRIVLNNMILLSGELIKVTIVCTLLLGVSPRVLWIAIAHFVASLSVVITQTILSRRMIPAITFSRKSVRWNLVKELSGFGFNVFVFGFARFLRATAPIWILNRFGNPVDVTSYHLGETAYRQSMQTWAPVRQSVGPPLIAMSARNELGRLRQAYYRGGRIALWLVMFVSAPLIVFHEKVIYLYAGETYQIAGGVMLLLLLRFPLQLMNTMLPQLARAIGQVKPLALVAIGTECFSISAILLMVWGYGYGALAAAAGALAASLVSELFFVWKVALRLVGGTRAESLRKTLLPGLLPSGIAGLIWYMSLRYFESDTWGQLALAVLPGSLTYIGAGFLCLLPEDRSDLNRMANKIGMRFRTPHP